MSCGLEISAAASAGSANAANAVWTMVARRNFGAIRIVPISQPSAVPGFGLGGRRALAVLAVRRRLSGKILPPAAVSPAKSAAWGASCARISNWPACRAVLSIGTPLATTNSRGVNRMFESIFGIHEQALLLQGQRVG